MDNLLIGWAIHHAGLPAVAYGAEVSLFDNPLTAAFMRNLGAYRVDRRLEHKLYKVVLTELSQCLIERGYPGLFFAAGKRSRTNQIEQQLKLGLLGSVVGAYVRNVTTGMVRPVPATQMSGRDGRAMVAPHILRPRCVRMAGTGPAMTFRK